VSRRVALVLALLALTGCASIPKHEQVFHALNALDQAQSVHAISRDCFQEVDPITRDLLGAKPFSGEFVAYGAAIATGYHYWNRYAEANDISPRVRFAVHAVALGAKVFIVARNHERGMRPWGRNPGCAP
jgi:hypothetical protein